MDRCLVVIASGVVDLSEIERRIHD